jgi:hypothetical protein
MFSVGVVMLSEFGIYVEQTSYPQTALDDDEVVGFTQNGGWRKVDNLLPLLHPVETSFCEFRGIWIRAVRNFSDHPKVRHSFLRRDSL